MLELLHLRVVIVLKNSTRIVLLWIVSQIHGWLLRLWRVLRISLLLRDWLILIYELVMRSRVVVVVQACAGMIVMMDRLISVISSR